MKLQLTVALGLAVLATPALATKARLEALGEDNFGSYFINDNRNQFLNPAQINNHKDIVTFEFGSTGNGTNGADAVRNPKAVGGVNKSYGNMVYGLYFGDATPSSAVVRSQVTGGNLQEQAPIDLFVGGDAGLKWGANVTYDAYDGGSATSRLTTNALRVRGGVIMGDTQVHGQVSIKGDAKDYQGREIEGKSSYFAGVAHAIAGTTYFVDYKAIGAEITNNAPKYDWDFTEARLGAGHVERLNDKANLFAKLHAGRRTVESNAGDVEAYVLPINIGLETEATSWLTLRASVGHNLWSNTETDPKPAGLKTTSVHVANTAVRAGATLKFGELSIDGLISTSDVSDGETISATNVNDPSTNDSRGTLRTDNLMTRVAMTYRF